MPKKSALATYRSLEAKLAEARSEKNTLKEQALITQMDDVWYNQLTDGDRRILSKEA
jgi:hypothetical protein